MWVVAYFAASLDAVTTLLGTALAAGGSTGIAGNEVRMTPYPEVALRTAPSVTIGGPHYQVIFQARVRPDAFRAVTHPDDEDLRDEGGEDVEWFVSDLSAIRLYGMCSYRQE